jgi:hypothetical protein
MAFSPKRISELDSLTSVASGDLVPIVDISDTAAGVTKQASVTNLAAAVIVAGNITTQGNTFNGASQLVQLNASTQLPAVSGLLVTTLNASNIASGTLADARLSTQVTVQGNTFNGASQLVQMNASTQLPAVSGINLTALNASNISSGTIADARLSSQVTVQGNTFNGASQLVQMNASTQLPAVSGINLTALNASNLGSGTIPDARLSASVELKTKTQTAIGSAGLRPLVAADADAFLIPSHASGVVTIVCPNNPAFTAGFTTTIFCNTAQSVAISADSSVTVYYVNAAGLAQTIAPSGVLTPSAQRGRVFRISCIASNVFFLDAVGL